MVNVSYVVIKKSHPSWVRGLKLLKIEKTEILNKVAPLVGAWIETYIFDTETGETYVAPLVGAWIETGDRSGRPSKYLVAPLVGAWIETY